jgi:hypothetical protein
MIITPIPKTSGLFEAEPGVWNARFSSYEKR